MGINPIVHDILKTRIPNNWSIADGNQVFLDFSSIYIEVNMKKKNLRKQTRG